MSASSSAPLPSGDAYVAAARTSCAAASTAFGLTPNIPAIDSFLRSLDESTFDRLRTQHGLSFPLRFPTQTAEVNFLGILALLNAFSGYRTAFHKATGIGAYQNVIRLMIGLYISGDGSGGEDRVVGSPALTSKGMSQLTETKVVELLGVSVHEERQHETLPGVTVGVRQGDMFDAVQLILSTINNVGKALLAKGHASLGAYLVELMKDTKAKNLNDMAATDYLVKTLATDIPEFRDTHTLSPNGEQVYLFKRIFFLLHSLHLRFADKDGWGVPNTYKTLPMFVDNVLPTLCVWFNFFNLPSEPQPQFKSLYAWVKDANCNAQLPREKLEALEKNAPGPKLSADETYAIRAACLNVGAAICERAKLLAKQQDGLQWLETLNEVNLDGYLWAVAKDDEGLRRIPRLVFASIHF